MSRWTADERHRKDFGSISMVPLRGMDGTAHLIEFPNGTKLRVLPDDASTGQKRSKVVSEALSVCEALMGDSVDLSEDLDPETVTYQVVVGYLSHHALSWEIVGEFADVTIEEWLDHWFLLNPPAARDVNGRRDLLIDLAADGWVIERIEGE